MCLRFVFLLITRVAAWLRLSRREEVQDRGNPDPAPSAHGPAAAAAARPKLNWADRAPLAALPGLIPKARRQGLRLLVTPDTIARWHRDLVRRRWAARSMRGRTAGQRPGGTSRHWFDGWPARTPNGDTAGSTASWPASG